MVLAGLAFFLSLGIWLQSGLFVLWVFILFAPALLFFVKVYEERELEIRFGASYLEYKSRTPVLFPRRPRGSSTRRPTNASGRPLRSPAAADTSRCAVTGCQSQSMELTVYANLRTAFISQLVGATLCLLAILLAGGKMIAVLEFLGVRPLDLAQRTVRDPAPYFRFYYHIEKFTIIFTGISLLVLYGIFQIVGRIPMSLRDDPGGLLLAIVPYLLTVHAIVGLVSRNHIETAWPAAAPEPEHKSFRKEISGQVPGCGAGEAWLLGGRKVFF